MRLSTLGLYGCIAMLLVGEIGLLLVFQVGTVEWGLILFMGIPVINFLVAFCLSRRD